MLKLSLRKTFMCKNVLHLSNVRSKDLGIVSFLIYNTDKHNSKKLFHLTLYCRVLSSSPWNIDTIRLSSTHSLF